jgi:hypothetical protein
MPMRPAGPPPVVLDDDDGARGSPLPLLVRIGPITLLLAVLAAIFVITAFAAGNHFVDTPARVDPGANAPPLGSCIDPTDANAPVPCTSSRAVRVERYAPGGDECAGGTVPVDWNRDVVLCVRPPS